MATSITESLPSRTQRYAQICFEADDRAWNTPVAHRCYLWGYAQIYPCATRACGYQKRSISFRHLELIFHLGSLYIAHLAMSQWDDGAESESGQTHQSIDSLKRSQRAWWWLSHIRDTWWPTWVWPVGFFVYWASSRMHPLFGPLQHLMIFAAPMYLQ